MAQLFKTISLEERLKASPYNTAPSLPKPTKEVEGASLKLTPEAVKVNSQILKASASKQQKFSFPAIGNFNTEPISKLARPFVNTKFRSSINLADRLKQPKLGSTTHLSQFFLADLYTDYIKITPFGIFTHTSNTVLSTPPASLAQGGVNPTIPTFISELAQGMVLSNGTYYSFINVQVPDYDSLILQGTYFSNGAYSSLVVPTISISSQSLVQGGINPTNSVGQASIALLQGLVADQANNLTSLIVPPAPPTNLLEFPNIVIANPIATPNQGGEDPVQITFQPERTSPILNVLKYAADRALAFFTPTIKHGSAILRGTDFQTAVRPNQGTAPTKLPPIDGKYFDYKSSQVSPVLSNALDAAKVEDVLMVWIDWQYAFAKPAYYDNNNKAQNYLSVEYVKIGGQLVRNPNTTLARALGASTSTENLASLIKQTVQFPKSTGNEGSLASYKTLTYDQIVKRANDPSEQRPDFRKDLGISVKTSTSVNRRGIDSGASNDFVTLQIASMTGQGSVKFRSFITSFSDGWSVSWNDLNYVGRQDTLKTFKGATRAGSVAFKVAAFNLTDLNAQYAKLNKLTKIAAVGAPLDGGLYIAGPLCKLTIGNWFTNTPVVFNSVKFDVQMADYSWDIDKEMPQLVDVSLDFAVLGDVSGKPLNAASNDYFNYR